MYTHTLVHFILALPLPLHLCSELVVEMIFISCLQHDALLIKMQGSLPSHYKDMDDKLKILKKRLSNDHAKILYCLDDLGLICAYEV